MISVMAKKIPSGKKSIDPEDEGGGLPPLRPEPYPTDPDDKKPSRFPKELGEMMGRVDRRCAELGMSKAKAARLAEINQPQFTRWRDGRGKFEAFVAIRLAKALDVTLEWLVEGQDPEPGANLPPGVRMLVKAILSSGIDPGEAMGILLREARRRAGDAGDAGAQGSRPAGPSDPSGAVVRRRRKARSDDQPDRLDDPGDEPQN